MIRTKENSTRPLKVIEWNINKRSNSSKKVKPFVCEEILSHNPDIIILTEYLSDLVIFEALSTNYNIAESLTLSGNSVLIGVKKDICKEIPKIVENRELRNSCNFLHVDVTLLDGKTISVIGVRMLSPMDAPVRTPALIKYLAKLKNPFICGGDFNIKGEEGMNKWFPDFDAETLETTEEWYSKISYLYVYAQNAFKTKEGTGNFINSGAIDHILHSKDLQVKARYDWGFANKDNNYADITELKPGDMWRISPPNPDHAIMIADITWNNTDV